MPNQGQRFFADSGLGSVSAVVATLPLGCTLGEERIESGVSYRLCYNAAANSELRPGRVAAPQGLANASPNSVTVTTTSQGGHHIAGVVNMHSTVPTGYYFWGAQRGLVGGLSAVASAATGALLVVSDDGNVDAMVQSVVTGKVIIGFVVTSISNGTGTKSGNCFVSFM